MGVLNGSISYALYHVDGALPDDFRDHFLERIEEFVFRPLTPDSPEDMSVGWVVVGELLNTTFSRENVFRGSDYLCLSLRVDRWSLPAALFKAVLTERVQRYCEEQGRARLSKLENEQLREVVRREFKEQMLPSAAIVDVVWSLSSGEVRFWSHSKRTSELFQELFESTFAVRLLPSGPYITARAMDLSPSQIAALADVESDTFTEHM